MSSSSFQNNPSASIIVNVIVITYFNIILVHQSSSMSSSSFQYNPPRPLLHKSQRKLQDWEQRDCDHYLWKAQRRFHYIDCVIHTMCIEILLHIQIKKITEKQDEERNEEEKKTKRLRWFAWIAQWRHLILYIIYIVYIHVVGRSSNIWNKAINRYYLVTNMNLQVL